MRNEDDAAPPGWRDPASRMPKSGDPCSKGGVYTSTCPCQSRLRLEVGLYFTSCVICGKRVEWRLVEPTEVEPE